jgi:hypothetical protein
MAKKTARSRKAAVRKPARKPASRASGPRPGKVKAKSKAKDVRRVVLPPSQPAGDIPCGRDLKWAGVTIAREGGLPVPPALLQVCTGDVVSWVVSNESGRPLSLRLKDFERKSDGKRFSPIRWLQDSMSITHGSVGTISGEVVYLPAKDTEVEYVKYTIEVRGPAAIDYDPDLEIRRPPI